MIKRIRTNKNTICLKGGHAHPHRTIAKFRGGQLCDVRLQSADGECFLAHSVCLTSNSDYVEAWYETNESKDATIALPDVPSHALSVCLEFLYAGEATVSAKELRSVLKAAKSLQIPDLVTAASTAMDNVVWDEDGGNLSLLAEASERNSSNACLASRRANDIDMDRAGDSTSSGKIDFDELSSSSIPKESTTAAPAAAKNSKGVTDAVLLSELKSERYYNVDYNSKHTSAAIVAWNKKASEMDMEMELIERGKTRDGKDRQRDLSIPKGEDGEPLYYVLKVRLNLHLPSRPIAECQCCRVAGD